MPEFKTEKAVHAYIESTLRSIHGCYYQKIYLKFTSGFPDLVVGHDGRVAFYELKVFKDSLEKTLKRVEPIQRATISRQRQAGLNSMAVLVRNEEEAWVWYPGLLEPVKLDHFTLALNLYPAQLQRGLLPEPWVPPSPPRQV